MPFFSLLPLLLLLLQIAMRSAYSFLRSDLCKPSSNLVNLEFPYLCGTLNAKQNYWINADNRFQITATTALALAIITANCVGLPLLESVIELLVARHLAKCLCHIILLRKNTLMSPTFSSYSV